MKMFTSVAALNSAHPPVRQLHDRRQRASTSSPSARPTSRAAARRRTPAAPSTARSTCPQALTVSSDVYFYGLGNDMWTKSAEGQNILQDEARRFGFGEKSGIDLPFENAGILPDRGGEGQARAAEASSPSGRASSSTPATTSSSPSARASSRVTPLQLVERLRHLRQRRHALPAAHRPERAVARHARRAPPRAWSTSPRAASCAPSTPSRPTP